MQQPFLRLDAFLDSGMNEKDDKDRFEIHGLVMERESDDL